MNNPSIILALGMISGALAAIVGVTLAIAYATAMANATIAAFVVAAGITMLAILLGAGIVAVTTKILTPASGSAADVG
jgi:hypothetical protein